jgi:hypothetical protein
VLSKRHILTWSVSCSNPYPSLSFNSTFLAFLKCGSGLAVPLGFEKKTKDKEHTDKCFSMLMIPLLILAFQISTYQTLRTLSSHPCHRKKHHFHYYTLHFFFFFLLLLCKVRTASSPEIDHFV